MTIMRDGEAIAFYLDSEVVCPLCVTEEERALSSAEDELSVEELEAAVEEVWCDRCDTGLIRPERETCCT